MDKIRVFEAFSGYGSQSMSLRDMEIPYEMVGISEIEPDAIIAYGSIRFNPDEVIIDKTIDEMRQELIAKNIGKDFKTGKSKIPKMKKDKLELLYKFDKLSNNYGDISILQPNDLPDFDYFTYSFPCTDISVAGQLGGIERGKTRSGLLYECEKIIEHKRPKYLLLENVKNLVGKKFIADFNEWLKYLESIGYKNYWKVLNAKEYGIPQNRERVFVVSILDDGSETCKYEFPKPIKLDKRIKDILEDEVDPKYYLSDEIQKRFIQTKVDNGDNNVIGTTAPEFRTIGQRDLVYSKKGIMGSLVATDYKQPKQLLDDKPILAGGFGEKNFGSQYRQGNRVYDSEGIGMCLTSQPVGNLGGNSYLYKVDEPSYDKPVRLGGVFDTSKSRHQAGSVWHTDGVSPTLDTMQGGYRQPCIICERIPQTVKVRKYEVNVDKLKETLQEGKKICKLSNRIIAEILKVNKTTVDHWFRTDSSFSIPDAEVWMNLKKILRITTDEFDKSIMEFEIKDNEYDISNRAYHEDGIAPTLTCNTEHTATKIIQKTTDDVPKTIYIPQATKSGYIEMEVPGVCDLSFPNSKTRRGRVQDKGNVSPTLTSSSQEICYIEYNDEVLELPQVVEQRSDEGLRFFKDNMCGTIRSKDSGGDKRIIDYKGIEVELPCIGASRGRNPENPTSRVSGLPTEQQLELNVKGTSNAITTVQKDNYVIDVVEGNGFKFNQSGENVAGEMTGPLWEKRYEQARRVYDVDSVSPTIPTCQGGGVHPKILEDSKMNFRIRKLTPYECMALMGVSYSDYHKMKTIGLLSDSSLYRLAGNSIVKHVLDAIHTNLFKANKC